MQCPICSVDLHMSEKQGVEIDYCPKCRGIWLDRGELEKLIEKANAESQARYDAPQQREQYHSPQQKHYDDHDHKGHHDPHKAKKKKPFGGDLRQFTRIGRRLEYRSMKSVRTTHF